LFENASELKVSGLVHENQQCPSVVPVLGSVKTDENRVVMTVPFCPIPVLHAATVNDASIVNMAPCGLAFSNKGLCHGDIKPSNMMFQARSRTVVLTDFGSCTAHGDMLTATLPAFGVDCGSEASL